jgi:hypothetical protein
LTALDRLPEADLELTAALAILEGAEGPKLRFLRRTLEALVELREKQGRGDEASALRQRIAALQ